MITKKAFGEDYSLYTIENENGMKVGITDLGATVQFLLVKNKNGGFTDVVLGYDTPEEYLSNDGYIGAFVGRYANRIGGARFVLNGVEYKLCANDGENTLHGGEGYDKRKLDAVEDEKGITFSVHDPDGENGFPGNVKASVRYELSDDNRLTVKYSAVSDKDTVVCLTNHSYFNLRGEGDILSQYLRIGADAYLPVDDKLIPTGEIRAVAGTEFDFREMRKVESTMYDHSFVLDGSGFCAEMYDEQSGIDMKVYTDMPAVQLYCSGSLAKRIGKGGAVYDRGSALCLETQFYPDSPNKTEFPSTVLRAGESFKSQTCFEFDIKQL